MHDKPSKAHFLGRLLGRLNNETPSSREDISRLLHLAHDANIIDTDTLALMEKTMAFSHLEVRDVMVTRSQMDVIKLDNSLEHILSYTAETAHSRFPVIGEDKDEILGILHTKDLLQVFQKNHNFDLRSLLREAVFVPEGKSLNTLIKEFRDKHIHLAIVVDEYGGVSGLVTLEDVLEEIIGDIEDEFDKDEEANIIPLEGNRFRVNAVTEITDFNEYFNSHFPNDEVDTVGGLIVSTLGRLPQRGEKIILDQWTFTVTRVDRRRLHTLIVTYN